MVSTSIRAINVRTIFLLLIATAKRVSKLRAGSMNVGITQGDLYISYLELFLAKTETQDNKLSRFVKILSVGDLVGNDEDRLLCPVRAVKLYLEKVRDSRVTVRTYLFPSRIMPGPSQRTPCAT